ncbi:ABC transporter substrate-binding protein [Saccharospirillum salsuginis]|uniref:Protein translocase component YidC n=1 Tax=Saccharospirillum salsuginis TaxID=418750 RepID=A0A918N8Y0_9GAMM|nr:ABC transporter substrate-binding protein [Saccharospirillum salsuginis]GGX54949.1 protein translocase component YidC [Saccharospirillum salsuginis]
MKSLLTFLLVASVSLSIQAADMRTFNDHTGSVDIPADPQRIVALNDHVLAMPLIELGAPLVGSSGRVRDDGSIYLRGVKDLLGVDFDNSPIEFIGTYGETDMEKIVSLSPDLIVAFAYHDDATLERMRKIAPTVVIDTDQPVLDVIRDIADAGGVLDEYNKRLALYQARLDEAKSIIPNASDIQVSVLQAYDGKLSVYESYGALGQVIQNMGFKQPEAVSGIEGHADFSAESLTEFDGDFIFDTYRISAGDLPQDARERMAEVLPGWCDVLHACRTNQYVVLPRTFVYSSSFASLELNVQLLVTHIGGRNHIPYQP